MRLLSKIKNKKNVYIYWSCVRREKSKWLPPVMYDLVF